MASEGLEFKSLGGGQCTLVGLGTCTDTEIEIPEYSPDGDIVKFIEDNVFPNNQNITSLILPDTLDYIPYLRGMSNLTYIKCPNNSNIEFVGASTFKATGNLMTVILPPNIKYMDNGAFSYASISNIVFPNSLLGIGDKAFMGATLQNLILPQSLIYIGLDAFLCTKTDTNNITIPDSILYISPSAFGLISNTSVNIYLPKKDFILCGGWCADHTPTFSREKEDNINMNIIFNGYLSEYITLFDYCVSKQLELNYRGIRERVANLLNNEYYSYIKNAIKSGVAGIEYYTYFASNNVHLNTLDGILSFPINLTTNIFNTGCLLPYLYVDNFNYTDVFCANNVSTIHMRATSYDISVPHNQRNIYLEGPSDMHFSNIPTNPLNLECGYLHLPCAEGDIEPELIENVNATYIIYEGTLEKLSTPTITINNNYISWQSIENATYYKIYVNQIKIGDTSNTYFDVTEYIEDPNEYTFSIKASADGYSSSDFSNEIHYTSTRLKAPTQIIVNNDIIYWSRVSSAIKYRLVNQTTSNIFETTLLAYTATENGNYYVIAVAQDEKDNSNKSDTVNMNYTISPPTVQYLSKDRIQFSAYKSGQFKIYKDGIHIYTTTSNTYTLTETGKYNVTILNNIWGESSFSNTVEKLGDVTDIETKQIGTNQYALVSAHIDENGLLYMDNEDLPSNVISIYKNAFRNSDNLKLLQLDLPNLSNIGMASFLNDSNLTSVILINTGLVSIGNLAFKDCISLTNISIPSTLVRMGDYAFSGTYNLISIDLSSTQLFEIGKNCFEKSGIEEISLPSSLSIISESCFLSCRKLKNVHLSNGIEAIERYAFMDCRELENIELPNTIERIEDFAFNNCNLLRSIRFNNTPNKISNNAFSLSVTDVYVPWAIGTQDELDNSILSSAPYAEIHYNS